MAAGAWDVAVTDVERALLAATLGRGAVGGGGGGGESGGAAAEAAEAVERGAYLDAVTGGAGRAVLLDAGEGGSPLERLAVGAACLLLFLQANVTGPPPAGVPASPKAAIGAGDSTDDQAGDAQARRQLSVDGEELVGVVALPQWLVLSRRLLLGDCDPARAPGGGAIDVKAAVAPLQANAEGRRAAHAAAVAGGAPATASWWAARCALAHQRILSRRAPTLRFSLVRALEAALGGVAAEGVPAAVAVAANLEAALVEHEYKHQDSAERLLAEANRLAQLSCKLTGQLGFRTVHQQDAKAQHVVRVAGNGVVRARPGDDSDDEDTATEAAVPSSPEVKGLEQAQEEDVLRTPRLVDGEPAPFLRPLHQVLVLAAAVTLRKSGAEDELVAFQANAFSDQVAQQTRSRPLIRAAASLLTARHERNRGRTRERSLLTLEKLCDGLEKPAPSARSRMRLVFCTWVPPITSLRKELGEMYLGFGLVGGAIDLFEKIELWDSLITCYQMLDKRQQVVDIVRKRLEKDPDEPKLWCALGDSLGEDEHYHTAWERSGKKHARSQRSLARSTAKRGDFEAACTHWELALGINPIHHDGWFAYGYAALKCKNDDKALHAFTRCTQLEPTHGESWNNVAALHLKRQNFDAAFVALKEAVKYLKENWHLFDNFTRVALATKHFQTAARNLLKTFELSDHQQLDTRILLELVRVVKTAATRLRADGVDARISSGEETAAESPAQRQAATLADVTEALDSMGGGMDFEDSEDEDGEGAGEGRGGDEGDDQDDEQAFVGTEMGLREFERFASQVEAVLKRAAEKGVGGADLWVAYGNYKGVALDRVGQMECLLKAVRALQMNGWQKNEDAFEAYARASLELCNAQADGGEDAEPAARVRDVGAARMHLRGLVKAASRFEDLPTYAEVTACLERVEALEKELREEGA